MNDHDDALLFNPFSPEFQADPYPTYAALRAKAPVLRSPLGVWVASRYGDVAEIIRDGRWGHGAQDDGIQSLRNRRFL